MTKTTSGLLRKLNSLKKEQRRRKPRRVKVLVMYADGSSYIPDPNIKGLRKSYRDLRELPGEMRREIEVLVSQEGDTKAGEFPWPSGQDSDGDWTMVPGEAWDWLERMR